MLSLVGSPGSTSSPYSNIFKFLGLRSINIGVKELKQHLERITNWQRINKYINKLFILSVLLVTALTHRKCRILDDINQYLLISIKNV